MDSVVLTIKNYRCFEDTHPVSIHLKRGFTALVGPNNAGKSSLLRLFYETRNLWHPSNFAQLLQGQGVGIAFEGVYDPAEIHCDRNDRPLSIKLDFDGSSAALGNVPQVSAVTLSCVRNGTWNATFEWLGKGQSRAAEPVQLHGTLARTLNGEVIVDLAPIVELSRRVSSAIYVGPFRNAISEAGSSYYDLAIGSSFISTWHDWQTGPARVKNQAIYSITEDIRRIFGFKNLQITASTSLKTLQVTVDGKPYKLRELGAGIAQFIVVFGTVATRQAGYVLIDEPELNLHPSLQIDFLTSLASYTSDGVFFATHSLGLARASAEMIYSLQRDGTNIIVRQFEQTPNYAEFAGEMSFASFRELGFEQLLLVEGVTDVKTIQQFLRFYGKEHRVVMIPLGGDQLAKGGMEHELSELLRLTPRISALVDSERESDASDPGLERQQFRQSCKRLGISVHLTDRRAIENYLTDYSVKSVKGPKYRALLPFERLRDVQPSWDKSENWRIANRMTFADVDSTDLGEFFRAL